jgi:hypothetical protein
MLANLIRMDMVVEDHILPIFVRRRLCTQEEFVAAKGPAEKQLLKERILCEIEATSKHVVPDLMFAMAEIVSRPGTSRRDAYQHLRMLVQVILNHGKVSMGDIPSLPLLGKDQNTGIPLGEVKQAQGSPNTGWGVPDRFDR